MQRNPGFIPLLTILLSFIACASLPEDYDRPPSTAFQNHLDTRFGQLFEAAEARRKKLLASVMELYELRPDASVVKQRSADTEAKAALHTKAVVFDRESVFIGSFNLDPRSANINTEAGLYVESGALAEQLTAYMDEGVESQNSYRVVLDEEGELEWITEIDGREVRYHKEPDSTIVQRLSSYLIQLLPVEHQL